MKQKTGTKTRVLAVTAISAVALATIAGVVKFGAVVDAAKGSLDNKAEYGEQLKDQTPASLNLTELSDGAGTWYWVDPDATYFGQVGSQKFVVRNAATDAEATAYREVTVPVQQRSITPVVKYGAISGTPANYVSSGIASINTYKRTVSVSSDGNGTVSGSGSYVIGQSTTIKATPNTGFKFVQWNDGNTNSSRSITVASGTNSYTATFAVDTATVSVSSNNTSYGTVSGGGTYDVGSSVTITATPKTNYHFVKWSDGNTSASRSVTVKSGTNSYTATFAKDTATVSVSSNNTSYGTVSGSGTYDIDSSVTIKATPKTNHHFVRWNDGNTNATRTITVTRGTNSYTATFAVDTATVTVSSNNTSYGTVSGGGTYDVGSSVTITATPKTNCYFVKWSDGNTSASRSVTVKSGTNSYTATFEKSATMTVTSQLPQSVNDVSIMKVSELYSALSRSDAYANVHIDPTGYEGTNSTSTYYVYGLYDDTCDETNNYNHKYSTVSTTSNLKSIGLDWFKQKNESATGNSDQGRAYTWTVKGFNVFGGQMSSVAYGTNYGGTYVIHFKKPSSNSSQFYWDGLDDENVGSAYVAVVRAK